MKTRRCWAAVCAGIAALAAAGCGSETAEAPPSSPANYDRPPATTAPRGVTRQEAFLARIKGASQGNGVIREARMNGDSELGIVLGQQVKLRQIKPLLTTLIREMRNEFPNRVLTVRAYAPNGKELAVMRHDPSQPRNRDTTFTPTPGLS